MADIGVVTISLNQARYLPSALGSVLQSDVDVEYVVVDAGSTDGSRAIIREVAKDLAAVIFEPDDGPADGLKKGMSRLTSQIIGYLNADDVYLPGALREVSSFFATHPNVDVVLGHSLLIDEGGHPIRRLRATSFTPARFARSSSVVVQQSTFFRRSAFERVGGFNKSNATCWDAELLLDMAMAGARIETADRYWAGFRAHGDSITVSGRLRERYRADHRRLVVKALGRQMRRTDRLLAKFGRVEKWLRHPDTLGVAIVDRVPVRRRPPPVAHDGQVPRRYRT